METPKPVSQGQSKRVTVIMGSLTAVVALDSLKAQMVIAVIALGFVVSESVLTYFRERASDGSPNEVSTLAQAPEESGA